MSTGDRRALAIAACAVIAVFAGGCAIQPDSAPRDIPEDRRSVRRRPPARPAGWRRGRAHLPARARRLRAQLRTVQRDDRRRRPDAADGVDQRPEPGRARAGYRSAVPATLVLRSVGVDDGVVQVDVNDALLDLTGGDLIDAVAQIVLTASEIRGARSVLIRVDGARSSGQTVRRAAQRPAHHLRLHRLRRVGAAGVPGISTDHRVPSSTTTTLPDHDGPGDDDDGRADGVADHHDRARLAGDRSRHQSPPAAGRRCSSLRRRPRRRRGRGAMSSGLVLPDGVARAGRRRSRCRAAPPSGPTRRSWTASMAATPKRVRQHPVERRRRAAALDVAEHDDPGLEAGAVARPRGR